MKYKLMLLLFLLMFNYSCTQDPKSNSADIILLHHSTGSILWYGHDKPFSTKVANKLTKQLTNFGTKAELPSLFAEYNKENNQNYSIRERAFPRERPYGWNNFPYDYYNIWVKNACTESYLNEPTLEILTKDFEVIIFKHCFPVCYIEADADSANINSDLKTLENYKLQYQAIRDKLHQFKDTKFIVFTGAAQVKLNISEEKALRANEFFEWVINEWDLPNDNIFVWDFYQLQTEGELYFKNEYAMSPDNSHPNGEFAHQVVGLLFNRIIDVIENNGNTTDLKGGTKQIYEPQP